jgi:hypothetical protein
MGTRSKAIPEKITKWGDKNRVFKRCNVDYYRRKCAGILLF